MDKRYFEHAISLLPLQQKAFGKTLLINITSQKELQSIQLLNAQPGEVTYSVEISESVKNYHGKIHGGFLTTLNETAAGMATQSHDNRPNVAVSCTTNFIKASSGPTLYVTARSVHAGKSTAVISVEIKDTKERLITTALYTMFFVG